MKTLGRILIIVAAFAAVMGITYVIVNANSSSTAANPPAFERGGEGPTRIEGRPPQFMGDEQPEFGERPEFGRDGRRGGGWMFGWIKNVGIIAVIVALSAALRSVLRKKPAPAPAE